MKRIRNFIVKSNLIVILALGFVLFSCQNIDKPIFEANSFQEMTGEEIFSGIFFSTGFLKDNIPQLKKNYDFLVEFLNPEEMQAYIDSQGEIISLIKKNDPNAFKEFKKATLSGNHYVIKNSIQKMTQNLVDVQKHLMQELNEKDELAVKNLANLEKAKIEEAIQNGDKGNLVNLIYGGTNIEDNYQPLACSLALTCVVSIALVFTIGVVVTAAVAVATAVEGVYIFDLAIAISETIGVENSPEDINSLELETLVNSIAITLRED